jgi:NAD-dependent dihydropyrimidine dehydrogenase PreA subunit
MRQEYLKNVVSLAYDPELCRGCGRCVEVCPQGVFEMAGGKARIIARDHCMECGACALNCPFKALAVQAGVGCAEAIIGGWLTGKEPSCC